MVMFKDVFPKESALRDYLAANLHLIEDGLSLTRTEFSLSSELGAGGAIDILAADTLGHSVIIELKKSDATARAALHELSKYILLLIDQEGLGRDEVRCVIVSSDWHELLVPFSYFRAVADVQVDGYHAVVDPDGALSCNRVSPCPVLHLPTFSPEFDLFTYATRVERDQHWEWISSRAKTIPFVHVAMCRLDPKKADDKSTSYRSVVCIWRISDTNYEEIERVCGFQIGHLTPYAFPGWEPECDVLFWLASDKTMLGDPGCAESQRGTAEKVTNILTHYDAVDVLHCGRGKIEQTLNDVHRVIELLRGRGPRLPIGRRNPVSFQDTVSVENPKSLTTSLASFLEFIGFVPYWQRIADKFVRYAQGLPNVHIIDLRAFDKKHFFYALYQATVHANAELSHFSIELRDKNNQRIGGIVGMWSWDGTCPNDALAAIEQVYGDKRWARVSLLSAVDDKRYDVALEMHGLHPIVVFLQATTEEQIAVVDIQPDLAPNWTPIDVKPLRRFVETHPDYIAGIIAVFDGFPTEPGEGVLIVGL